MAETPVMLVYHPAQPKDSLGLTSFLFKTLGLSLHEPVTLVWPGQSVVLNPYLTQSQGNVIHLPSPLAEKLHLPDKCTISVSVNPSSQTLKLKPILAILVSDLTHPPPFGELNDFLREVIRYAQKRAVVAYVVTLPELAPCKGPLWGWTYEENDWVKRRFPLPHVIYNRISSRKIERSSLYATLKKNLAKEQIILFNQTFLNKWDTYVTLASQDELKKYLPHTVHFDGRASLKEMLKKYPVLYLKPVHGSLGRGIYKLMRAPSGFQVIYNTLAGEMVRYFFSLKSLVVFLSKRIKRPYILQEGINLLNVEGGPVDFRVLMQKNGNGQWQVTSLVARIGGQNQIVSNISRGGKMARVLPTLKCCGVAHPKELRSKLASLAKQAAQTIDQGKGGLFGELGVDLAVSTQEQIYILEVNAKPSKTTEALPTQGKKVRPSVRHLVDYTIYLSRLRDEVEP